ncbi:MAG TPA: hypothetical protein VEU07_16375 [Candidatus Acidoferrum sp.]|nr:hypothetical protein [Candidatus Acidoferrum sp.]
MGKAKSAKRNKKLGELKDLPATAKQAAAVKGGLILPYMEQGPLYNKDNK